jgi:hypothetical protein
VESYWSLGGVPALRSADGGRGARARLRADLYACARFVERRSVRASVVSNARRSEHGDGETGGGWWCVVEDRGHGRDQEEAGEHGQFGGDRGEQETVPGLSQGAGPASGATAGEGVGGLEGALSGSSVEVSRAAGSTPSVAPSAGHLRRTVSRAAPQAMTLLDVHPRRPAGRGF